MEFQEKLVSYEEVKSGKIEGGGYAKMEDARKAAFLANPNLADYSQSMMALLMADGKAVARIMLFDTRIKTGEGVFAAGSGSSLHVSKEYRKYNLGADLMMQETPHDYRLFAGISDMALPLYKVMRYKILEYPRMMLLCNSRCILEMKGLKGIMLNITASLVNIPLRLLTAFNKARSRSLIKRFEVKKESVVPEWVDDMVLNDGHKYMEVHDKAWLQWNLDYHYKDDPQDIQSFYSIYKGGIPVGFFMTKERFRKNAGGQLKNLILAAIVEWGIDKNCKELDETILYKMALSTFTKNVDIIEFATTDLEVCKKMKRWGFIKHGFAHIAFQDKKKNCKDAGNIELWRIRYGYADVILT